MPLHILIAWASFSGSGAEAKIRQHAIPVSPLLGGVPEYAFDPHNTRVRRRAVELWRNSFLAPPPWTARQIGMALWNIEAAACDKTLDWPTGQDMRRRAYRADLISLGVPEDQHVDLNAWIIQEKPALTVARQAAFRSVPRP